MITKKLSDDLEKDLKIDPLVVLETTVAELDEQLKRSEQKNWQLKLGRLRAEISAESYRSRIHELEDKIERLEVALRNLIECI